MVGLFRRDVTVAVLASGSSGNCTYVGDGRAGVLIDCGLSTKRILQRMGEAGLRDAPIDAVLITHEHTDHVGSAGVLSRRLRKERGRAVPFFMTAGTHEGAPKACLPDGVEILESGVPFRVRHLHIDPFTVPHDVLDPVAYRITAGEVSAAVVTDLGRPTALVARKLRGCDVLVLEYNHDLRQLMEGPYPWHLKQRIRSNHGHLSNAQANDLLAQGMTDSLRHVVLAHLSEHNNTPAKAKAAATRLLKHLGNDRVQIQIAQQHALTRPIALETNLW